MNRLVYLVNPSTRPVLEFLKEKDFEVVLGDGKVSEDLLKRCWAMIPGKDPVTKEVLDKAPELKLIVKKGVGLDRIDIPTCTERGICVANTPFTNYISVAEHAIALLMAAAKKLYPISLGIRCENPDAKIMYRYQPIELYGKTLSVIGLGNIGMYTAKLGLGLGMKVLGYARHPEKLDIPEGIELAGSMEEALQRGDFVSLHVAGTKENHNLIGARELGLMKPTAILINTTRGFVIDEEALYNALTDGPIAGAALDVFAKEPIQGDNPLLKLVNVTATPHSGGYTSEANTRGYFQCAEIIAQYAEGIYPATAANQV